MSVRSQPLVLTIAVVAVIIAAVLFVRHHKATNAEPGAALATGVVDVAAKELAGAAGGGPVVLVIARDPQLFPGATPDFTEKLTAALRARTGIGGLELETVRAFGSELSDLPHGAPVPPDARGNGPQLSLETFKRVEQAHANAKLVISLVGPPEDGDWTTRRARLGVVMQSGDQSAAIKGLKAGIIDVAIVPRERGDSSNPNQFAAQYQVLTPATVSSAQ